jgi:hypothetical protein
MIVNSLKQDDHEHWCIGRTGLALASAWRNDIAIKQALDIASTRRTNSGLPSGIGIIGTEAHICQPKNESPETAARAAAAQESQRG